MELPYITTSTEGNVTIHDATFTVYPDKVELLMIFARALLQAEWEMIEAVLSHKDISHLGGVRGNWGVELYSEPETPCTRKTAREAVLNAKKYLEGELNANA